MVNARNPIKLSIIQVFHIVADDSAVWAGHSPSKSSNSASAQQNATLRRERKRNASSFATMKLLLSMTLAIIQRFRNRTHTQRTTNSLPQTSNSSVEAEFAVGRPFWWLESLWRKRHTVAERDMMDKR